MIREHSVKIEVGENGDQLNKNIVKVLGFPVPRLSATLQFIALSSAVFVFYITYGYMLVSGNW